VLGPGKRKLINVKFTKQGQALIRRRHLKHLHAVLVTVDARGRRDVHVASVKLRRKH
jgi:hypothetical protein